MHASSGEPLWQTTPIRAAFIVFQGMWHHVTLSQKMRLALPANISLTWLTSSEVLPCAHRADMLLDIFQRSQRAKVRSPPLFENFLKQHREIEGSCKVYEGKHQLENRFASCAFASKKRRALEAQMTPTPGAFVCSKACEHYFNVNDQPHVFEGTCYEAS